MQAGYAARHPHKVRSVFADPVYVEGWGTFCERLLLDLGWGGPLPRLAHLKKQLENVARTIVDVRVHTTTCRATRCCASSGSRRCRRTSSPATCGRAPSPPRRRCSPITWATARCARCTTRPGAAAGSAFELRAFMDDMMALGPVPVRHYRRALSLGSRAAAMIYTEAPCTPLSPPLVGVIMGSRSDWDTLRHAVDVLEALRRAVRSARRLGPSHAGADARVRR